MINFRKIFEGLRLVPKTTSNVDSAGEMDFDSTNNRLNLHNGTSSSPVVTISHSATGTSRLKNKDLEDSSTAIVDASDVTKKIIFNAGGTTGTSTTIVATQTSDRTLTLPDTSGTLVTSSGGGTITNQNLDDSTVSFVDTSDNTKKISFDAGGTTSTSTTLAAAQTANRVLTLPDLTDNIVSRTSTDTLTNKTLAVGSNSITGTASRASQFGAGGSLEASAVTSTELGYVSGVTSAIQTQLDAKASSTDLSTHISDTTTHGTTGDIVGTSDTQTLTNKSLSDSTTFIIDEGDNTKKLQFQASGITTGTTRTLTAPDANTTIVGIDTAQIITNKDIDGGTAANNRRITLPKDTKTNLDALTRKEATVWYSTDQQKLFFDNGTTLQAVGSGSGTGGINYILNPDAETNTDGWTTYADAADSEPVDGTPGGSPNVTFTRNTSNPLRTPADFVLTKDAADRQGQGVSYDFEIDNQDKGKRISIEFDYAGSANFVAGESSDVRVFIYDITNAVLILPERIYLLNGAGTYKTTFYASDSNDYRLILHVATTNASAWTLAIDHFIVGPGTFLTGPAMSDWTEYELIIGATVTPPTPGTVEINQAMWRRDGDTLELRYEFKQSAAGASAGSGFYLFPLPNGLIIDSNKITTNNGADGRVVVGSGKYTSAADDQDATSISAHPVVYDSTNLAFSIDEAGGSGVSALAGSVATPLTNNFPGFIFTARIPIEGWSSNNVIAPSGIIRISEILANGTRVTGTPPTQLGEYRSYLRDAGAATFSEANGDPAVAPSIANGIKIYNTGTWAASDTNNEPSRYEVFIGKNKAFKLQWYSTTGRTGFIDTDTYNNSSSSSVGYFTYYDPTTGILTITPNLVIGASMTSHTSGVDATGLNGTNDPFFDIYVADNDYQIQQQQERSEVWYVRTLAGTGSTNTSVVLIDTEKLLVGDALTPFYSATDGFSCTVNKSGIYSIYANMGPPVGDIWGITRNAIDLINTINGFSEDIVLGKEIATVNGFPHTISLSMWCNIGDIIRVQTEGSGSFNNSGLPENNQFRMIKISN